MRWMKRLTKFWRGGNNDKVATKNRPNNVCRGDGFQWDLSNRESGSKLIPVYTIYAARGRPDCGFEAKMTFVYDYVPSPDSPSVSINHAQSEKKDEHCK